MRQQHGSGKTAVLVERIIHKILVEKLDITSLLVVTFTNAAAAEMRERVLNAIDKKLEEFPEDVHLQKQTMLIHKASICTIHSFCLDVIKNHFYEIDLSPNFRIGDTSEIELLKQEVLDELFEQKYLEGDKNFLKLLEIYTNYREDDPLKEMILEIYRFIQSSPFPKEWLEEKINDFLVLEEDMDFGKTVWGKILLKKYETLIEETILGLKHVKISLDLNPELDMYSNTIQKDIDTLNEIKEDISTWDETYQKANLFAFQKWPVNRKITSNIKDEAKAQRDKINKKFKAGKDKIFIYSSKEAIGDVIELYEILNPLKDLILEFEEAYQKAKREKNMIDFNDIEHFALKILVQKDENGNYIPTQTAKKYQEKFSEIAIDEYQDSNLVQEYILQSISRGNNIFMVGDIKQSIYKFRQARPELFLEKYDRYQLIDNKKEKDDLKIQLFKNFRSRENVLNFTNLIFQNIMSKELGNVEYNEKEYLNLGANYEKIENENLEDRKIEIDIIDIKKQEEDEWKEEVKEEQNENIERKEELEETGEEERIEDITLEARFIANKVKDLIANHFQVWDKKIEAYREVTYQDIVILLRSTITAAPVFEKELLDLEIPVFSDSSTEYLDSIEIQTILSVLKILDNPFQEIPLVIVLRSMIGNFSDNDLIKIRLVDPYCNFYEAVKKARLQVEDSLKNKIENFLDKISNWREKQEYLLLNELIWHIYNETDYYNYVGLMPNGKLRQANLKMLLEKAKDYENASFHGLFHFLQFIEKMKANSNDMGAAKVIGENENVVRIMSIHKSKGLEFPVVILAGTHKRFNMQDLNQKLLLHQELGIGPKYINYEKKIEYDTLIKEAVKSKVKVETLSEEERILYVALTRSKEKLIITGISKDIQKDLEDKENQLQIYFQNQNEINSQLLEQYKTYLDWIELVYLKEKENVKDLIDFRVIKKEQILDKKNKGEQKKEITNLNQIKSLSAKGIEEKIEKMLNWEYPYQKSITIPNKVSVTKLKMMKMEQSKKEMLAIEKETDKIVNELPKPNFLSNEINLTPAQKGTILHLCLQKLSLHEDHNIETIKAMIKDLVEREIITKKEAESISYNKILEYTKSKIWQELKTASLVEREKTFYIYIPAKEVYQEEVEEKVLVQGIIDLYYLNQKGELVLVDYKTDYVEKGKEKKLKEKYIEQLQLYQRALEKALKRKVDRIYIYSTYLGKEIQIK